MASDGQHMGLRGRLMDNKKKKKRPSMGSGMAERGAQVAEKTVQRRKKRANDILNQIRAGR